MSQIARNIYIPQLLGGATLPASLTAPRRPEGAAEIDAVRQEIVAVHTALDVRTLDGAGRKLIQNPQTADAPLVARAQLQAMRAEPEAGRTANFDGAQVGDLGDKHTCLRQAAHVTAQGLDATAAAIDAERAGRAAGRARVRRHIDEMLGLLPEGDPERAPYEAARSHLDAADERERLARAAPRARDGKARAEVRSALRGAEADLQLAEVLHKLRTGEVPDEDALLAAAARLAEREAEEAGDADARRAPRA